MKDCCNFFGFVEELSRDTNGQIEENRRVSVETRNLHNQKGVETMLANELWLTAKDNHELADLRSVVMEKRFTASIRLGDRTQETSDPKGGYKTGLFIKLKLQMADSSFDPLEAEAVVKEVRKKTLRDVSEEDLLGTLFSGKSKAELVERLEKAYQRKLSEDDLVTVVRFEYLDSLNNVLDLVRTGVLAYAREPKGNPEHLNFTHYTVPLTGHDYPAKTPAMWNAAYREFGINAGNVMLVGDSKQTRQILGVLRRDPKYRGGGAAVGFKDEAPPHLDELEPTAQAIGAVNFILKTTDGRFRGFNTDGLGYTESLKAVFARRGQELKDKRVFILGAGGAGNAIAFTLAVSGAEVIILNRKQEKAVALAERINNHLGRNAAYGGGRDEIPERIFTADAVVAAIDDPQTPLEKYVAFGEIILPPTPENLKANLAAAEQILAKLDRRVVISDIMLRTELTATLREAQKAGFEILDGIPMVINQGVEAFSILYGDEFGSKGITKDQILSVMTRAAGT